MGLNNIPFVDVGARIFSQDTGAADAYIVTLVPIPLAYTVGMLVNFIPANANTGASVINVNGLGNKNIKNAFGADPSAGDISTSMVILLAFDGTNFIIQAPLGASNLGAPTNFFLLPSTFSTTNTSFTNVTDFLLPLNANTKYQILCMVTGSGINSSNKIDHNLVFPTSTSGLRGIAFEESTNKRVLLESFSAASVQFSFLAASTYNAILILSISVSGTAGNVQLQIRNKLGGGASVTLTAGFISAVEITT